MESPSNDVCCICLDEMNEHQYHKELSCGHKLHFQCFKKLVFRKNMFVKCPVCRENNTNIDKPTSDPFTNIRLLSSSKVGNVRCLCKTKKGTICKHKSKLLNYKELENLGYNIVIYPVTTQRLAMKNVEEGLRAIFADGHQNNIIDKMQTRKRLYDLVEYEKYNSLDEKIYNFSTEGHE